MAGELTSISLSMGMGVVDGNVQPVLGNLSVSPSSATVGTAYNGAVSGKTAGSTLTLSGAGAAGLSVSGSSITGTPTASGAVDLIETLAGATGSPKTNAGLITVAAAGAVAFVLPTPAFSATNGISWHDFSKTYKNSAGVDQPSLNKDLIGYSSVSSWLDMFGQGNELSQPDKALQPLAGSTGPINDAIGHPLVYSNGGLLTGKNKVSFWCRLKPRFDLYTGSAKRTLIYISKGPTSAILLGTPTVASGGSGYNVGDYIILTGGTASTQAILKVASVSVGAVTSVSVVNQGAYTVAPSSPVSQGSSSGAGAGATFNATFSTIGTGSANERFAVYMTGGANRRLYVVLSVGDGTVENTSTTLGPQVPDNVFATIGVEVDLVAQTATFYVNSTTPTYQVTGFPAAVGTFGTRDSVLAQIGDNSNSSSTAYSEWAAQVLFSDTSDSTRLAALKSYLDGAAA